MPTFNGASLKCGSTILFTAVLAGCNYSTTPLCDGRNARVIPALTGKFSMTIQDQDFDVEQPVLSLRYDTAQPGVLLAKGAGTEETIWGRTCAISDKLFLSENGKNAFGYSASQILSTKDGFALSPLVFDKKELSAAQISWEIVNLPAENNLLSASALAKQFPLSSMGENSTKGILAHTEGVTPEKILTTMRPSTFGIILNRSK